MRNDLENARKVKYKNAIKMKHLNNIFGIFVYSMSELIKCTSY